MRRPGAASMFAILFGLAVLVPWALVAAGLGEETPAGPPSITYGDPRQVATLANSQISESSGLACGRRNRGVFWTHNDSGDSARVFAFTIRGEHVATYTIVGAQAGDWEDMASFEARGKGYLLLGDVGDNERRRKKYTLYVVVEPPVGTPERPAAGQVRVGRRMDFTYEDGPHNCEAVAIDPTDGMIYLVSKEGGGSCKVYALPWRQPESRAAVVAKAVATLAMPAATAMDISPDGLRAVILTYGHAYEYARRDGEKWSEVFARPPRVLRMPQRRQGETVCYGPDGKTLYLTSEFAPTPLFEVPVAESK